MHSRAARLEPAERRAATRRKPRLEKISFFALSLQFFLLFFFSRGAGRKRAIVTARWESAFAASLPSLATGKSPFLSFVSGFFSPIRRLIIPHFSMRADECVSLAVNRCDKSEEVENKNCLSYILRFLRREAPRVFEKFSKTRTRDPRDLASRVRNRSYNRL